MRRHRSEMLGRVALSACALAAFAALLLASLPPLARAAEQELTETGSTLMLPLLQSWAQGYAKGAPETRITTAGTNSAAGIAAAINNGTANIGASDAYMSDLDVANVLNIPLAISAQTVNYNLPGLTATLRLSGPVLAGIYAGRIRDWSDAAIAALNPGTALPHHAIVPIRRSDASGDTFIFTQFLSFSTP